jgi:glycerophosphoryl diester phosphodiesterase
MAGRVRPLVIAHRGASGTCPENTLAAFRRAEELGADMIELDVQLTRDAAVVVLHDETLERTTSGVGSVGSLTLAELRRLDAGAWFDRRFRGERVPTLADVLAAVALPVNVELKPSAGGGTGVSDLASRALATVRAAGALERVVFSSFEPAALTILRTLAPDGILAVLSDADPRPQGLALAKRVGARALHLRKDAVTRDVVAAARAEQVEVRAWTVNAADEFARLAIAGVTGIFTDHPERFLQTAPAR